MLDYRHLQNMTDSSGILQFSLKDQPDPTSGYTLDDNARGLLITLYMGDEAAYDYARCYANYLYEAQKSSKTWSNLKLNGQFYSCQDSADSIGRAILACSLGSSCQWPDISKTCTNLLKKSLPLVEGFTSPRAIAYVLIGLCKGSIPGYRSKKLNDLVARLTSYLVGLYQKNRLPNWKWFEDSLTYCNGILPHALFSVYAFNRDRKALRTGRESLNFLNDILFRKGYLNIVGNQGWYKRGTSLPLFDQQPVDAASIALACLEAYQAIGKDDYRYLAGVARNWYRGLNIHGLSLYNEKTGGCYDALTFEGVNLNQGAEAALSLLLTDLALERNISIATPSEKLS